MRFIFASVLVLTTLFFWIGAGKILWKASVTGKMPARDTVYDREIHPVRYYIGFIGWIVILAVLTFGSLMLVLPLP